MRREVVWSSDMSKSESWGKTTGGKYKIKKKHHLPKRAVNFLLRAGKKEVEWRNTQRKQTEAMSHLRICTSIKDEVHLTQRHLSTQQPATPESLGYTPLAVYGKKEKHY